MTDVAPRPTAGMLDLLNGFVIELRNAGLPVSLTENLDAMEAVQYIPIEDREAFKYALGATLIKNNSHWRAFETVFEVYFSLRGPEYRLAETARASALDARADELYREGTEAKTNDDHYILSTLFFAAVLFFAGISLRLDWRPLRSVVLGMAAALLLAGVAYVLTLPVA